MVSTTLMGPVLLIFSLEVLGLTGMESSAFFSVGMTESDICLPISAKNLTVNLNFFDRVVRFCSRGGFFYKFPDFFLVFSGFH